MGSIELVTIGYIVLSFIIILLLFICSSMSRQLTEREEEIKHFQKLLEIKEERLEALQRTMYTTMDRKNEKITLLEMDIAAFSNEIEQLRKKIGGSRG
jgi:peptidoglycan hydrolase CwlO-like protein